MNELIIPRDVTSEEVAFLQIVKKRMLSRLDDRLKFIFIYCFELGHKQSDAAEVLHVTEPVITKQIKLIREILTPFKY